MIAFEELTWLFASNRKSRKIVRLNIAEGALLYKYCKKKYDGTFLEIGRRFGGSTILMAATLLQTGHIYSIDTIMQDSVKENLSDYKDCVTLITGDSKKVEWELPLDILFIDGDHSYAGLKSDINRFMPYVEPKGYVIFHDVIFLPENPVGKILWPLIEKLLETEWNEVERADSMVVLQRR